MGVERFVGGGNDFRMVREAEVVVGTEIDDRVRFSTVVQGGARFRGGEHLRLVKFDGPFARLMPFRENRRRLQRVLAVPDKEIVQAESSRIGFDRRRGLGDRL